MSDRTPARRRLAFTAAGLAATVTLVGGLVLLEAASSVGDAFLAMANETNRRQADHLAGLLAAEVRSGTPQDRVVENLQRTLASVPPSEAGFVCLLDRTATVLCHPASEGVGSDMSGLVTRDLSGTRSGSVGSRLGRGEAGGILLEDAPFGGVRQVVHQRLVDGTPWVVSVHANRNLIEARVATILRGLLWILGPAGILLVVLGSTVVRALAGRYERRIEQANATLEARVAERTAELEKTIEELHRAQDTLVRTEKMVFLGQLLSSLAHELNNPLTVITGYADLGLRMGCDAASQSRLRAIHDAGARCGNLIRTFLAFARNTPPAPACRDLNDIVGKACMILGAKMRGSKVDLEERLAPGIPTVLVDGLQIEQVALNLADNARQAIVSAGRTGRVLVSTGMEGDGVVLRVEDDGPGLPESIRERLFEPFRTTKADGEGTGLGLSICRRFVEANGGRIDLERTGSDGTVFAVRLPPCGGDGRTLPARTSQPMATPPTR